jgi:hypothetical protein
MYISLVHRKLAWRSLKEPVAGGGLNSVPGGCATAACVQVADVTVSCGVVAPVMVMACAGQAAIPLVTLPPLTTLTLRSWKPAVSGDAPIRFRIRRKITLHTPAAFVVHVSVPAGVHDGVGGLFQIMLAKFAAMPPVEQLRKGDPVPFPGSLIAVQVTTIPVAAPIVVIS